MSIVLKQYIDVEVERLANNIVSKAIHEKSLEYDYNDLLINNSNDKDYYDINKLNSIKNDITLYIQDVLSNLDNSKISDYFIPDRIKYGRFKGIKSGVICDISLGSLKKSVVFANIGPSIPIRLLFTSQIDSSIDIDVEEYGINNVVLKLYLIVTLKEQINMPISSERKDIVIKTPLSINIIRGKIPSYYYNR